MPSLAGLTLSGPLAVAGVFGVALVIGILVLTSAEASLVAVARAAARDISRCFWIGLVTQALALPALALACVACGITLIGVLAIPVVILLWLLALSGTVTMGVLGVAAMLGIALVGTPRRSSDRPAALQALTLGLAILCVPWLVVSVIGAVPVVGLVSRVLALALTWSVTTIGMGAVVRAKVHARFTLRFSPRRAADAQVTGSWTAASPSPSPAWMTPTPVQGVAAARRLSTSPTE